MKVAIQTDSYFRHSFPWTSTWIEYCRAHGVDYEEVDARQNGILEKLKGFDCFLWHFKEAVPQDMLMARSVLYAAANMGIKTFPDFFTAWHHDDKIAETYLLNSLNAPFADSWMFYDEREAVDWAKKEAVYPLVAKLKSGSGSNNVQMIRSYAQAKRYVSRMFGSGFSPAPSIFFRAKSDYRSAQTMAERWKRLKRLPDFLKRLSHARQLPRERGYVYFQEFIPNDGFDLKVAVVGNKINFVARRTRQDDFRASGSGFLFYDRAVVPENVVVSARDTARKMKTQSVGFDYVVDNRTNEGKIVEMSFCFSHKALRACPGHWEPDLTWNDEPLDAAEDVIKNLIAAVENPVEGSFPF